MFRSIGRFFVLLNFLGSMVMLAWAAALYTQPIQWFRTTGPQTAAAPKGNLAGTSYGTTVLPQPDPDTMSKIELAQAKIKLADAANARAVGRWQDNIALLPSEEEERALRRTFYHTRLEIARTGGFVNVATGAPVKVPQPLRPPTLEPETKRTKIDLDRTPDSREYTAGPTFTAIKPTEVRVGIPAESSDVYLTQIETVNRKIDAAQRSISQAINDHVKSTQIIFGTEKTKGLRLLIKEQKVIEENAISEREYLEDFVTNRRAQGELFIKRKESLDKQLEAVQKSER